jgi:hypothetical protein
LDRLCRSRYGLCPLCNLCSLVLPVFDQNVVGKDRGQIVNFSMSGEGFGQYIFLVSA